MKLKVAYKSIIGKIRPKNEDNASFFYDQSNNILAIVADGIGGNRAGEVASKMAVDGIGKRFTNQQIQTVKHASKWFQNQIDFENQEILAISMHDQHLKGMGTTFVGFINTGRNYVICNIGDSRGYLFRNTELTQLTEDHSYVNELLKAGKISKQAAATYPYKNVIVRSLGISSNAEPTISDGRILIGDQFLLCSDGLTDLVSESVIKLVLQSNRSIAEKCEKLTEMANQNGGSDNITVLIIETRADQGVDNHG
ncbi:Stp1/IreP family PP2C-type Ser/Thr phosphatase [Nicoliella spurrieriana]|uniref:Stp1/IreP family PP2C-type Ser/Thr phosphatase n=1 Tax=Nicoliella spurrieriana TaxID=2925830 RepID=A0A976X5J1_9LACO|nr:Stp1/IreP family PP2C-type Ser/Thr phosphatase [Nicoliella spurrieriana]UQS86642.1 Stp1/IreP family PP2C-type Ser/Thr phosphatase [Nicoliella spurrieriana]